MASKKGTKVARPTLEEVKAQPGRNLFVTYEGVDRGFMSIPALRPRFAGDIPEELLISPWEPRMISEEWLDDVRFRDLYNKVPGIRVWKTEEYPRAVDLKLPEELEKALNSARQQTALQIASTPYTENMKEIVHVNNIDVSSAARDEWENTQLYPFLEAILFFEYRLMKRPEVIKDVEKRLKEIDEKISSSKTRERWKKYGA